MKNLTEKWVSMIIITHNLGVVARYADRVNVMYAGKIVESGSAEEIYHNPRHPYTLALLKSVLRLDLPRAVNSTGRWSASGFGAARRRLPVRPRCKFATDGCGNSVPELEEVRDLHWSRCRARCGY